MGFYDRPPLLSRARQQAGAIVAVPAPSRSRLGNTLRLGVLLLLTASLLSAEHLPVKIYTTADGLARNRVHGLMEDSRGFIWISTGEGLSQFDGYRFVNYGTRDGLPSRLVFDVLEARDGSYWVATGEGLSVLHPKSPGHLFTLYHQLNSLYDRGFSALVQDRAGVIWAATDMGLYRETGPGGVALPHPEWTDLKIAKEGEASNVRSLLLDRQGSLWIGTAGGLCRRYPDGRVEVYSTANGLPTSFVEKVLQDTAGRIWVGTREGLCRLVADPHPGEKVVERIFTEKDGLGWRDIKALSLAPDGSIWAGCLFGGVSEISLRADGQVSTHTYSKSQGLNDESILALLHDRAGNLWVGGESGGLMRIVHGGFLTYTKADGLVADRILQIFEDQEGNLCVSGNDGNPRNGFLSVFDDGKFRHIDLPGPYNWPSSWLLHARSGEWWIAHSGLQRLGRMPLAELRHARPEVVYPGNSNEDVYTLFEDSLGGIWATTGGDAQAVLRWDPHTGVQVLPHTNGPVEQVVTAIAEDRAGDIWLGLYLEGVVRYRNGVFTQFGTKDGFPYGYIRSILADEAGRLWIASGNGGLGRIDDPVAEHPKVRIYDAANSLSSDTVTTLTADRWGRIYAGTGRGLDRLDPANGRIIHYTINDGLANDTPLSALRDRRGWLWFGTTKGLSRLIPEPEQPTAPPAIRITALKTAAKPLTLSLLGEQNLSGLELSSGDIQIEFGGVNFEAGENLRYQYRLEGAGGQWSAPSDQRSVNLAGLSPGPYRFQARAVDSRGQVSEHPVSVVFRIPPPLWGQSWFRLLALSVASLLLYALYRFRLDRMLELEHIRMRIATDLHDDIGSSLSQIAILSEVARRPDAAAEALDPLGGIARISRELVDSMSDIVWAVNPKRDNLLDLTRRMRQFAGEMLVPQGVDFTFDAGGAAGRVALGADLRRQVFLIFKESVNNAARHACATRVEIALAMSGGWLRLTVHDNGRGFDTAALSNGHGLASMKHRAAAFGGTLEIHAAPGEGTTIRLAAPLKKTAPSGHGSVLR